MENVFVKMADRGSGNVETCIGSLFVMKSNCLENLGCSLYDSENNVLNDAKCLTLEKKKYFSSCDKLKVTTTDCMLNACSDLHGSSDCDIGIPSFESTLEDADSYKKKRCVDRYDSSESSDSGVLTGSTCSESSSNSGNSDITDPCSPYSVASFHLGDDSGLSSTSCSKSPEFSNGELLLNSKMLPENSLPEEENDVSCWAWDKNIEWNDRYELIQDDIDDEVKRTDFFEMIGRKNCDDENDSMMAADRATDALLVDKIGYATSALHVNLVDSKSLNSVDNRFAANELSISTQNRATRSCRADSSKTPPEKYASADPLRGGNDETTKDFLYDKVFQAKNVRTTAAAPRHNKPCSANGEKRCSSAPAPKTTTVSKFVVASSYPLDFFNILPSVFRSPVLHSTECGGGGWESTEVIDDNGCNDDSTVESPPIFCCRSDAKAQQVNDLSRTITINNNSSYSSNNNNYIDDDSAKRTSCSDSSRTDPYRHYYHHDCSRHLDHRHSHDQPQKLVDDEDEDDISESGDHCRNTNTLFSLCERATPLRTNESATETPKHPSPTATDSVYKENIRFPTDKKLSFLADRICRWSDCVDHISSSTKLIEHLQTKHVNPQTFSETFICLWSGCKVFGRPSCSRTWLERHVLSHGGNKPYKCIVDNCGQRFSSQTILERHINQHFKTPKEYNDGVTDTAPKLIRRNGQKLRYRRQPYSVRSRTDVFDAGIMSQLQFLLVQMAHRSKEVSLNVLDSKNFLHVAFQPKVIGSRREISGDVKYLVRWYPYNTLDDEWLPKSAIESTKNVPIWKLPASVQESFWDSIFPKRYSTGRQPRKYKADPGTAR